MTRRLVPLLFVAMVCVYGTPAAAQQDAQASDPPAHISFVDGAAVLERDGRSDNAPTSMPLLAGDRIRTQGGRVEVLFADGSALHLDANTVVDLQSDDVVRLLEGRLRLSITGPVRDLSYRIDAPAAWVQINDPGEYRVAIIRDDDVELAVLRGSAELVNEQGRSFIRAGERTFARNGAAPSPPYVFNSASWDAFDRWSEARRDQRLGVSAQYLPNDVRQYAAAFDSYGDWRYEQPYGYVWYPRVQVGWRPYYYGRWASLRPYGWTWIGSDPWGWPTHHYGRWGLSAGLWFWIPGRVWAPAWVSWAYATDYVSWCPLGWNNRAVLQIVNVNVFGGRRYDPWSAWTVIPRRHFSGPFINVRTVASVRIDQRIHNTFVVGDRAPDARFAGGRADVPIRTAGRYAVPRNGAVPRSVTGDRVATGANEAVGERRFPAPAREPRSPTAVQHDSTGRMTSPGNDRAVARERSAGGQSNDSRAVTAAPSTGVATRDYRRAPDSSVRQRAQESQTVTSAPSGAVRAVPRVRPPDSAPDSNADRSGVRQERYRPYRSAPDTAPSPSSRATPSAPRSSPSAVDVYRAVPRSRSAPDAGSDYRSRSTPQPTAPQPPSYRHEDMPSRAPAPSPRYDPPSAPSYRSAPAPERHAPSAPSPSAAPSHPRSGGEGSSGGRQRSGEGQSSGQARRRG